MIFILSAFSPIVSGMLGKNTAVSTLRSRRLFYLPGGCFSGCYLKIKVSCLPLVRVVSAPLRVVRLGWREAGFEVKVQTRV